MEKGWLEGQACSQLYCDLSLVEGQAMLFQTVHQCLQCLLHVQQPGSYPAHCSVTWCRAYCIEAVGKPCAIGGCESSALAFSACSCSAGYRTIAHGSTMGVPISSSRVVPDTLHAVNIVVAAPWGCGAHILPCWFRACPRCGCCPRLHTATASIF